MHTSLSLQFINVQCLDMFQALLAHPHESLHGRRWWLLCVVVDVGWSRDVGSLPNCPKVTSTNYLCSLPTFVSHVY
jgi:hypothetical protein